MGQLILAYAVACVLASILLVIGCYYAGLPAYAAGLIQAAFLWAAAWTGGKFLLRPAN